MFSNLTIPQYFKDIVEKPVFLVDTDILSDICKGGLSKNISTILLEKNVTLLYSFTSIMELGFGPSKSSASEEIDFVRQLYTKISDIKNDLFAAEFQRLNYENSSLFKGKWVGISPDSHNWFAAKHSLINYMDEKELKAETGKKLQVDMLLSCTAWNAGAFIWSNNIKDHALANYYMNSKKFNKSSDKRAFEQNMAKHMSPIFTTQILEEVLNDDVINIYTEMKKLLKNSDVLRIIEIAETNNS